MKLEYFCSQKWEEEWIMQAKDLVCEEYAINYEKKANDSNVAPVKDGIKKPNNGFTSFGDLSVASSPHVSEIQEYLILSVESVKEPLKWWMDNRFVYLNLHQMALDYLSIPGMSYVVQTYDGSDMHCSHLHCHRTHFLTRLPSAPIYL
jgi:hypothetical protein